jgi:hypothetical protein
MNAQTVKKVLPPEGVRGRGFRGLLVTCTELFITDKIFIQMVKY